VTPLRVIGTGSGRVSAKCAADFPACRRPTADAQDDDVRTEDEIMIRFDLIMIEGASTAT
jgi:hypothetical protein